jgi:hypothetical protein
MHEPGEGPRREERHGDKEDIARLDAFIARRPEPNPLPGHLAATTAGLTLPYSSGPVEGNVNRIR